MTKGGNFTIKGLSHRCFSDSLTNRSSALKISDIYKLGNNI